MFPALAKRTLRDSGWMLAGCVALACLFVVMKIIAASQIKVDVLLTMISDKIPFLPDLLPVSIRDMASPMGRVAFTFEEGPLIAATGLWAIARGSECIVGRTANGSMELLLAQPVRRATIVLSHSAVSLAGAALIALATWLSVAAALNLVELEPQPRWAQFWPAAAILFASQAFQIGAATLVGAVSKTRTQAVGLMIGFYVIEIAILIISRLTPDLRWLGKLTFMTAYQPTALTIGLAREAAGARELLWQYNAILLGGAAVLIAASTAIFCRRDVPAPL